MVKYTLVCQHMVCFTCVDKPYHTEHFHFNRMINTSMDYNSRFSFLSWFIVYLSIISMHYIIKENIPKMLSPSFTFTLLGSKEVVRSASFPTGPGSWPQLCVWSWVDWRTLQCQHQLSLQSLPEWSHLHCEHLLPLHVEHIVNSMH